VPGGVLHWDAMNAKRLQLLGAFAAGCLATLSFVGSWWADAETKPREVLPARSVMVMPPQASAADLGERGEDGSALNANAATTVADIEDEAKPDSGSSLSEVLARLEAAYREERGREQAREAATAAPATESAREVTAAVAPVAPPVAPVAPLAAATPVAPVAAPAAPVATAERVAVAPAPVLVAQNDAPRVSTGDIHVGDTQRNVSVGSVHQGDAYALQQLALIQYIQVLALSQHGTGAAPKTASPSGRRVTPRRVPPFSTHLTNPDNPWGFDLPPTVLVK